MRVTAIKFEGSPGLGYLSHGQLSEEIPSSLDMEERRAGFLADKVFRQIGIDRYQPNMEIPPSDLGHLLMIPNANTSFSDWDVGWGGDWIETGIKTDSEEHNLVNLDWFVGNFGTTSLELKKSRFTPQPAQAMATVLENRARLLGVDLRGDL